MKKVKDFQAVARGLTASIRRSFGMAWPYHRGIFCSFFGVSVALSIIPFARSGAEAILINELVTAVGKGITVRLWWLLGLVVAISIGSSLVEALNLYTNKLMWLKLREFFELQFFKKKSEIDVAIFEKPAFRDLLNKAEERGVFPIVNLVESQFQNVLNVVQVFLAAGIFLAFDWKFFALATFAAVPNLIVESKYGTSAWDIYDAETRERRQYFNVRDHFTDVNRLIELRMFQNVGRFYTIVTEIFQRFMGKQDHLERQVFTWRSAAGAFSRIAEALMYGLVIYLVTQGRIEIGTMTFILGSIARFQGALTGFFTTIARQYEGSLYAADIFRVFDTEQVIAIPPNAVRISDERPPAITFENVSFAYPDTAHLVLKDLNLSIVSGERLAIVGVNGAGKTTLVKLLMRFYDPVAGRILVNGVDLRSIDLESWYSCVAALFQHYTEYNFPVREVIGLGRSNGSASLTRVVRSAKAADAHEFIVHWPNRYNQMIGREFDGIDPSMGQSQKIALARSFYRNARLLILDEPTASIDAEAEAKIFAQLEAKAGEQTHIIISHRFSTVRQADRICVLDGGSITELGTHEELMMNNETYAKLFRLQAKGYE